MFRNDLEASLQAYQFAELLLGGFLDKNDEDRAQALQAAQRLSDEAEPRFRVASASSRYLDAAREGLVSARARVHRKLDEARSASSRE